jgi:hypothetical protein
MLRKANLDQGLSVVQLLLNKAIIHIRVGPMVVNNVLGGSVQRLQTHFFFSFDKKLTPRGGEKGDLQTNLITQLHFVYIFQRRFHHQGFNFSSSLIF